MKHVNSGNCSSCDAIFDRFGGFHSGLRAWFKALQKKDATAHVSCAGRGEKDQEAAFKAGTSRAHYGQSAHNYNLALDIFRLTQDSQLSYDRPWFRNVVQTAVIKQNIDPTRQFEIEWLGSPGSKFYELPHCEVSNWKSIEDKTLVEERAAPAPSVPVLPATPEGQKGS